MRVIDPGHKYALRQLDGDGEEIVTYVKREGDKYPGNVGHHPGTNLQEQIRAQIDRVKFLDEQDPCAENKVILVYFRNIIRRLEIRAAKRHGREPNYEWDDNIELLPTCPKCGHIGCEGECDRIVAESI